MEQLKMITRIFELLSAYKNPKYWINNVSWRFPSTISANDTIFVVGAPRSGTTLLQRMLASHSQLFSIEGETGLFSYQNIFDPTRKHFGLSAPQQKQIFSDAIDIVDFFDKGVQSLRVKNNGQRFIEKTPQHIFRLPFILKHFPNSTIIHIVRDGRDCYCSSKSHPHIPQNKSVSVFAKYWRKSVSVPAKFINSKKILTVRYEELTRYPDRQLLQIMKFINLNLENNQVDPLILGKDKRSKLKEFGRIGGAINSSSVGRWKNELTKIDEYEFEKIAKEELTFYGYEVKWFN